MAVTLGHNQYGKAETRVVRVFRSGSLCSGTIECSAIDRMRVTRL